MQILVGLYILVLDQLSKYVLLDTSLVNTGIGWGLLGNQALLVTVLTMLVAVGVLILVVRGWSRLDSVGRLAGAALIAGTVSNLIDRVRFGAVVDPLSVGDWFPHFNLADGAIVVGLIVLILSMQVRSSRAKRGDL